VLEVILDNPEQTSIGGERRVVTTMMADIRGFSSMSEELPPDAVMDVLNYFFDQMVEAITMYHGTVIEFLGDAVLAVFGAPVADDRHTADAIAAALTMQNRMQQVNAYCVQKDYPVLEMGIAVHRGEVFIGNVGSEKMMRYNVVGRAVNACSRIESYSVGGQVLVSQETVVAAGCPVDVKQTMVVTPKGIRQPMTICEVIGIGGAAPCCLTCSEDCVISLTEPVLCHIYPVEGKWVKEQPFSAMLTACSEKNGKLELMDTADTTELTVYSDVELELLFADGTKQFSGVYAKVVAREAQCLTIRFTHRNREFSAFVAKLNENQENEIQ
jgi:adenylate cyclase